MLKNRISFYRSEDCYLDHSCYSKERDFPLHTHDVFELIFLRKGNAYYSVDGKTYDLSKNCLIITRPGENHAIKLKCNTEYERYNILFDESKLHSEMYDYVPADVSVINFDGNTLVVDLFKKMDYYCDNFKGDLLENVIMHLIEEVFYNIMLVAENSEQRGMFTVNPMIKKAVAYIEKNITGPINIEAICGELHITKSHLHQLFIKHMEISPKRYIISKKLILAQRELRTGKKPTEVFITCGFSDYSTFYRDYKKNFGHSPSEEINVKIVREIQS